jgi:hypothetical protein
MGDREYKPTLVAAYLESQGADADAAKAAGKAIARAWSDRYFFRSYTFTPLEKCLIASPAITVTATQLLERLIRHFGVHVHDVPEWEPNR